MILKVLRYDGWRHWHVCTDISGSKHYVYLMMDGPIKGVKTNKDLVGKVVECDYLSTYTELANGVRLKESA